MAYPPTVPPATRDNLSVMADNHPGDHNALAVALTDILNELGADPSAGYPTVQEALQQIATRLARPVDRYSYGMPSGNFTTGSLVILAATELPAKAYDRMLEMRVNCYMVSTVASDTPQVSATVTPEGQAAVTRINVASSHGANNGTTATCVFTVPIPANKTVTIAVSASRRQGSGTCSVSNDGRYGNIDVTLSPSGGSA